MELDKRIKNKEDILDCFDTEKAKKYIGQNGYFALNLGHYKNLSDIKYGTLTGICDDSNYPFEKVSSTWCFFIPECVLEVRND